MELKELIEKYEKKLKILSEIADLKDVLKLVAYDEYIADLKAYQKSLTVEGEKPDQCPECGEPIRKIFGRQITCEICGTGRKGV